MKKIFTNEVKIALVAIATIILLYFGMRFLKGLRMVSTDNTYFIKFNDVSGLSNASPVYANGYKVGVVKKINFDYKRFDNIMILIEVVPQLKIPRGSHAEITSDLLGNVQVSLILDGTGASLNFRDTIFGFRPEGVMDKMSRLMPTLEQMVPKIDSILYNLNVLLANTSIKTSLNNIETISDNLKVSTNELNTLVRQMNNDLPQLANKADNVLSYTESITEKLDNVEIGQTMISVNQTLRNVEEMTARMNSKDGTLGLLSSDPSLYYNLNSTVSHADSLILDLKIHPKRYVNFSLFGRKDK